MKSYTDLEQSRKLAEILPHNTADNTYKRVVIAGCNLGVSEEQQYIPDLTPHNDDEARECLAGICAYILSSSIFIWTMYLLLDFKLNEILSTDIYLVLLLVNCIIIYPILTIILMKLAFKIADKFIIIGAI